MDGWAWSNGGMVLTGENWSTGRKKSLYSVGGRWMDEHGAMVEWYWQGKTEVLGEDPDSSPCKSHTSTTHERNFHVPVNTSLHYKDQPVQERQQTIPWHRQHVNTVWENKVSTGMGRGKYSYHCPNDRHGHGVCRVRHTHTLSKKVALLFYLRHARHAMFLSTV